LIYKIIKKGLNNDRKTERGFSLLRFKDKYDNDCTLQKSSLATEDAIWFGVENPNARILNYDAKKLGIKPRDTVGWMSYPLPDEVSISTRMHLTQEQIKDLLPILIKFADTGELE
jgi:hypothetical protein